MTRTRHIIANIEVDPGDTASELKVYSPNLAELTDEKRREDPKLVAEVLVPAEVELAGLFAVAPRLAVPPRPCRMSSSTLACSAAPTSAACDWYTAKREAAIPHSLLQSE